MTAANYLNCYSLTRRYEGGNDDDPQDPGGRTSRGIIQREWDKFRLTHPGRPADVWAASEADIATIYRTNYWDIVQGDQMPNGIDLVVWDAAVNSGPGRGLQWLGQAMGSTVRSAAILASLAKGATDKVGVVKNACADRLGFLQRLGTFGRFGKGWSARVASVEANGVKMVLVAAGNPPVVVKAKLGAEGAKAKTKSTQHGSSAAGATAATGGGATQVPWSSIDWIGWLELGLGAIVIAAALAWFVHWALAHQARASAYADAAKTVGAT